MPVMTDTTWRTLASCARHDPESWFDTGSEYAAKAVCASCPVRAECLDYALHAGEPYGVWGGLTAVERAPLRDAAADAPSWSCGVGTVHGYRAHRGRDEAACPACTRAWSAYTRAAKAARAVVVVVA